MIEHYVINFRNAVPGAAAVAEAIAHNPSIQRLNQTVWLFSIVEISHLLLLAALGGAIIVLDLRVLGLVLPGVPVTDVERATRPWLWLGIVGGIATGTFMSVATALTLVGNGAFLIKILALISAIAFGIALAREARAQRAVAAPVSWLLAGLAAVPLVLAVWLFATTRGLNKGAILVGLVAGALGVAVLGHRAIVRQGPDTGIAQQVFAIGSLLAWATVGIGGRWIGFT